MTMEVWRECEVGFNWGVKGGEWGRKSTEYIVIRLPGVEMSTCS